MAKSDGRIARIVLSEATGKPYEEARQGWDLRDILYEDALEFTPHCELCHTENLQRNFLMEHQETKSLLKVGSICVTKFILMSGVTNQADSNRLFERKVKQVTQQTPMRLLVIDLMEHPVDAHKLTKFRQGVADYFGVKVANIGDISHLPPEKWVAFLTYLGIYGSTKEIQRVTAALFNPKELCPVLRNINFKKEPWQKSRREVRTTLSRSEAYRNPSELVQ